MHLVERLKVHYQHYPPVLSYGGSEGEKVFAKIHAKKPVNLESQALGQNAIKVWCKEIPKSLSRFPVEGYCVVDAVLDEMGIVIPSALPLCPEMEGHELSICIYVDMYDRILMKAIGAFTSIRTKIALTASK